VLWDEVAEEVAARHPDVRYERVLVDALAARMLRNPMSLDVVVASNLFGDVLTDIAAELQGGMGMAASASVAPGSDTTAVFEPVHGSAPDIAGQGAANPIAMIASFGMALRYSLGMSREADLIEAAIAATLAKGLRTADIMSEGSKRVGTAEMGSAIIAEMEKLAI
jgi:3-isopropylmalate dehydrogenase